jgi:4-hydroxybenzoate polyprenyltransferase
MANRWWTYQAERFPLAAHGPLIAAFSFCAVSYSAVLRGGAPRWPSVAVALVTSLVFFLQLRIADEFKDYEEDAAHRPYRPVPRGLVTLRELALVFAIGAAVQLGAAMALEPRLVVVLVGVWVYLAAMSKEFFVRRYLKGRPVLYMVSHMMIMPLIDLYATSTDWLAYAGAAPRGLWWFLLASFFNGMVIEIGRKVRAPADEEPGVQTYSALWGRRRAIGAWWFVAACTLACAVLAAWQVGARQAWLVAAVLAMMMVVLIIAAVRFMRGPAPGAGRSIERASGLWTLALYLSLGLIPLLTDAAR